MMDLEVIKQLVELLNDENLSEIEVKKGDASVRVSRQHLFGAPYAPAIETKPVTTTAPITTPTSNSFFRSPMVGTFYRSASPTTPTFVELGHTVKKGDVLCIIEAMKMMNQIESDRAGVVRAILVNNGEPVEYDQPMFEIV